MTPTERPPPQHDAVRVDAVELTGPRDDRALNVVLAGDVEQLTRLAGGRTEVAIVEQDDDEPGVAKRLSKAWQAVVTRPREALAITTQGESPFVASGRYT